MDLPVLQTSVCLIVCSFVCSFVCRLRYVVAPGGERGLIVSSPFVVVVVVVVVND